MDQSRSIASKPRRGLTDTQRILIWLAFGEDYGIIDVPNNIWCLRDLDRFQRRRCLYKNVKTTPAVCAAEYPASF